MICSVGNTALLLIDYQPEWYSESIIGDIFPDIGPNVIRLLEWARGCTMCVIHVRALYDDRNKEGLPGGDWGKWLDCFRELHPDKPSLIDGRFMVENFALEKEGEELFLKPTPDAFNGTTLDNYLKKKGIQCIILAGLITSMCVQHTAHGAFVRGYQVYLVEDCCGDRSLKRHQQAISLYGNYIYRVVNTRFLLSSFLKN